MGGMAKQSSTFYGDHPNKMFGDVAQKNYKKTLVRDSRFFHVVEEMMGRCELVELELMAKVA